MKQGWNASRHFGVHETSSAEENHDLHGFLFLTGPAVNNSKKLIIFIIIGVVIYDEMGRKQIPFP